MTLPKSPKERDKGSPTSETNLEKFVREVRGILKIPPILLVQHQPSPNIQQNLRGPTFINSVIKYRQLSKGFVQLANVPILATLKYGEDGMEKKMLGNVKVKRALGHEIRSLQFT